MIAYLDGYPQVLGVVVDRSARPDLEEAVAEAAVRLGLVDLVGVLDALAHLEVGQRLDVHLVLEGELPALVEEVRLHQGVLALLRELDHALDALEQLVPRRLVRQPVEVRPHLLGRLLRVVQVLLHLLLEVLGVVEAADLLLVPGELVEEVLGVLLLHLAVDVVAFADFRLELDHLQLLDGLEADVLAVLQDHVLPRRVAGQLVELQVGVLGFVLRRVLARARLAAQQALPEGRERLLLRVVRPRPSA